MEIPVETWAIKIFAKRNKEVQGANQASDPPIFKIFIPLTQGADPYLPSVGDSSPDPTSGLKCALDPPAASGSKGLSATSVMTMFTGGETQTGTMGE